MVHRHDVMTLPWHWLGLQGQWRRVANFNYADPIIAGWGPLVIVSFAGGLVLLASALLFVRNLAVLHGSTLPALQRPLYALAVDPPRRFRPRSTDLRCGTCWFLC
jgi:cytochrome c oxidase subunit 1